MANELFVIGLAVFFLCILRWGFKTLPGEGWQIIASLPISRDESGCWRGVNLTYYGLFTASAYVISVAILFALLGASAVPLFGIFALTLILLFICVPASRLMARIVEKKRHTFTIGGASFVGILIAPWAIMITNKFLGCRFGFHVPFLPAMAAFIIAYSLGEGMGRLACISFGCCYGKSVASSHPVLQKLFRKYAFMFSGKTKKVAYEGKLDGVKVIPVQAITAVLFVVTGLIGILLYLKSYYATAFVLTMFVTQGWRSFSEILRADYRGGMKISAYQIMAAVAILYSFLVAYFLPSQTALLPNITMGALSLWNPAIIILLLVLWFTIFLYMGRSTVTGAILTFHVHKDRI